MGGGRCSAQPGPGRGSGAGHPGRDGLRLRRRGRHLARLVPRPASVLLDCPACGQLITDHGPAAGSVADQDGHQAGCARLAAEAGEWEQEAPR